MGDAVPHKPAPEAASYPIKPLRIVRENLSFHIFIEPFHRLEPRDGIELARSIAVAVVGADEQVVRAGVGDDVWKVIVRLSRRVDVVFAQAIARNRMRAA